MSIWPSISQISESVNNGETSALSLVEQSLKMIEEKAEHKAIIVDTAARARTRAQEIDLKVKNGENAGRLAGVPFIAKDNFLVFGAETTAASNILRGFDAPYQATAIDRLEAEGAICVAKANLDAFAHGSSTENSDFFTTLNPYDKSKVPGGSSGGSAAAVALEMVPFALGTDTGGSIRLPASFCGIVGYKPTYGLVSRSGVIAMASSTDVIGPLTRTVEDTALVLDCMSGRDPLDGTTIEKSSEPYSDLSQVDLSNLKIGIVKEYFSEGLSEGVKAQVVASIEALKNNGAQVEEVSIPSVSLALACYYIICPAEVSSNLSRYDGQRYGYSATDANDLEEVYNKSRSIGFGDEAKRRIMIGTYVLSSGYYDAYYQKAQLVRTKLINEFTDAFSKYDMLVGPTAPVTAFEIGEHANDPLEMYLLDIMTVAANLTGLPSISVPCGEADGMPVGLQIIAPAGADRDLLAVAKAYEEIKS
jgi:aspartyl-tRNA(Asn)/glutamyl-tRNA(Gln) amidotransferase subunit A